MSIDYVILFQHYDLCIEGLLEGISCIDEDHGILHPFIDQNTGKGYLECLFCSCRINPGIMMINTMRDEIGKCQQEMWNDA